MEMLVIIAPNVRNYLEKRYEFKLKVKQDLKKLGFKIYTAKNKINFHSEVEILL